jgi:thiamine biosynthesis lipoprotein
MVSSWHDGVIGTSLQLRIEVDDAVGPDALDDVAGAAEQAALTEIERARRVFDAFDPSSELCRWRSRELDRPGDELAELLATAARWQERSNGVFNPAVGAISERWARAAAEQRVPLDHELAALVASIAATGARHPQLTLNAFAKGHLVDLAAAAAMAVPHVVGVLVNAGGDLVHRGVGRVRTGVEDPLRRADNAPSVAVITVVDRGVATSGSARRGVRIDGRWYSHVIDPRTARPVDDVASATVVAPDAATADVLATVLSVLPPAEGVAFVDGLGEVPAAAALVIDAGGAAWRSAGWAAYERVSPDR